MMLEIMDTTLRDGEQTSGVAFRDSEKLNMAKMLLEDVRVDRIEVASARISDNEREAVRSITSWAEEAGYLDKIEVLAFIDGGKSVEWTHEAGCRVVNLLSKGSLKHLETQLRKSREEHVADIKDNVELSVKLGMDVNLYLEAWSNGMVESPEYVYYLLDALKDLPIKRFMLPDTLGILNPLQTSEFCKDIRARFPDLHLDYHAHNDYDLAVANTMMAVDAGFQAVHTTVNGLGERTGNAPLSSIVAMINDHLSVDINADESRLVRMSRLVETFTGIRIPENQPILGEHVFTQTCGVHADGDSKGNLYVTKLTPERFGRLRKYALGKTSGKASIQKNLEDLGIELGTEDMLKVTKRVVELGDKKEAITAEDLPYIIADVLGSESIDESVFIENYYIAHAQGLKPVATLNLNINGKKYEETATGDGQYDAFMKVVGKIYAGLEKTLPVLKDYVVTIPPGGMTDALVETVVTWQNSDDQEFKTRALDPDQTAAAIKATVRMLNILESGLR